MSNRLILLVMLIAIGALAVSVNTIVNLNTRITSILESEQDDDDEHDSCDSGYDYGYATHIRPPPRHGMLPGPSRDDPDAPGLEQWQRVGIVKTDAVDDDTIYPLYQRRLGYGYNLFQYKIVIPEKRDLVLPLTQDTFIRNGDTIDTPIGLEKHGAMTVSKFSTPMHVMY